MAITLETLFTHPRAFGVVTASPCQRAACRIADGQPLGELARDEDVMRMVGGADVVGNLPGAPPTELYLVGAIRSGKSLFAAALAFHRAMRADLSRLKPTETARISVVSLDKDKAKAVRGFLVGALEGEGSLLSRYLVRATEERVLLRRDDGRLVEVVIAAGSVGGRSLVSRWTVVAIFDEAARMLGKADGAVNFDHLREAVIARLRLIGGQLIAVSSPWAARGPIFEAVEEGFGKPTRERIVLRATGPMLCPVNWTPEACERERLDPRGAYETDVLGLFVDPESGFLTSKQLESATRAGPEQRPRESGIEYAAAMDPAVAGNAWTLVVVGRKRGQDETDDRYHVALARQWQGDRHAPLRARDVFGEIAPILKSYGIIEVATDRWSGHMVAEHGEYAGVRVRVANVPPIDESRQYSDLRALVLEGRLELAPVPAMRADLLMVKKKLQPGGAVKFDLGPVTRDGRHADFAPALRLALARAASAPTWLHAMAKLGPGGLSGFGGLPGFG